MRSHVSTASLQFVVTWLHTRAHEKSLFNKHQYCLSRWNCNCKIIIETNSNYIISDGDSCVHVDRVIDCKPCRKSIQLME